MYPFFLVAVQHLKQTPDTLGQVCFHNRESLKKLQRQGARAKARAAVAVKTSLKGHESAFFHFLWQLFQLAYFVKCRRTLLGQNCQELCKIFVLTSLRHINLVSKHVLVLQTKIPYSRTRDMRGSFLNAAFSNTCSFRLTVYPYFYYNKYYKQWYTGRSYHYCGSAKQTSYWFYHST